MIILGRIQMKLSYDKQKANYFTERVVRVKQRNLYDKNKEKWEEEENEESTKKTTRNQQSV